MTYQSAYIIGKIPKLPAKYMTVVIPFILSFLMSGSISLVNILHNVGLVEHFLKIWMSAWLFSWLVAFPLVLILLPIVRRLSLMLVDMTK